MPIVISKRVIHSFMGVVVAVTFNYGSQSYDYLYDEGLRGVLTDDQALHQMEKSGFMLKAYSLFLMEVNLGTKQHDVEIRPA